ncbi:MAG TPA: hypothetical protein VKR21_01135, partial [Solirubrobacteraceae bacterium]|nr:hypothetical protein [Solirubrobacteraceae bacterium]
QLSCIDDQIAVGRTALLELEKDYVTGPFKGRYFASLRVLDGLKAAKACKDTLEVELMHSFDLKPNEQSEVGVNPTTPNGTDTQNPNKLNAPKTLEHAYKHDGFIGRHEQDYVANGVNGSNPDSWPQGRNVLFFDVFDLFGSKRGAQKAENASIRNLKSGGFTPIQDSSLAPGESAFQFEAPGSSVLNTILYVQRGTFIMKIAGACNGCQRGSVESTLKQEAQLQLSRAVAMGFPASSSSASHVPEEFQTSGNAPSYAFGQPGYHLCLYLHGPAGQTGNVKVEPGDATSQTDPNAQTYNQAFTLDVNGTAFFSFNEPAELFKITINRQEPDGSTNTTVTAADPRVYSPPPWGLPNCT